MPNASAPWCEETVVMDRLLDDLRTLSMAEAGVLELHRETVDPRAVARDVATAFRTMADEAGVTLTIATDAGTDDTIEADPVRLSEVLTNLLTNAIRHTPRGGHRHDPGRDDPDERHVRGRGHRPGDRRRPAAVRVRPVRDIGRCRRDGTRARDRQALGCGARRGDRGASVGGRRHHDRVHHPVGLMGDAHDGTTLHDGPMEHESRTAGPSPWFLAAALIVPLAGLALMLGFPSLDVHWEHHPSHFWLVFGVALLNVALGLIVSEVARRSGDERLFLVSMVLLTSAGFLALHALATPGVVLDRTERWVRAGDARRTHPGRRVRGALRDRDGRAHRDDAASAADAHARGPRRRVDRVGDGVGGPVRTARSRDRIRTRTVAAGAAAVRRGGVPVRGVAVPADLSHPPPPPSAGRRGGVRLPRRGPDRHGVRAGVAGVVVGVARADGDRVRHDRARRPPRVPPCADRVGHLRRHLPGAHPGAARPSAIGRARRARACRRLGNPRQHR